MASKREKPLHPRLLRVPEKVDTKNVPQGGLSMKKRNLIRRYPRMSVLGLCLFLVGGALLVYISANHEIFQRATAKSETTFNQNQYLQTSIAAQGLGEVFGSIERGLTILGTYSLVDFLEGRRPASSIESLFDIQLRNNQHLVSYAFFPNPENPLLLQKKPTPEGARGVELAFSWISRHWDEALSLPEGISYTLPPHVNPQEQFLGMLYPIYTEGTFRGVLVGVLNLHRLALDYVAPLRSGTYGAGFLLSGTGDVLYDHEIEIIGRNVFDGLHQNFPALLQLDARLMTEVSGKGEYAFSQVRGEKIVRKLAAWNSTRAGNLRLVVVLAAPDTEIDIFLQETKLFQTLSFTFLLFFMGGALFFFLRWNTNRGILENEERLKLALQGNRDGLWDYNPLTGDSFYSPRWKEMLGYANDEIPHRFEEWTRRIHPEDREETFQSFQEHLAGKTPRYENEHRLLCKNGTYKWIHTRGMVLARTSLGVPKRVLGTHTDIDSRKQNESQLHRFSLAVEQSPSAILITDTEGIILYVNASFEKITGYSREEALGQNPRFLKSGKQRPEIYRNLWETIRKGLEWRGEIINRRKDGSEIWVRISISPVAENNGKITSYVCIQEDITDLKDKETRLEFLATTDELTRIYNRRKFMESAKEEHKRSQRYGHSMGFVMFDIDHFKTINDTYGHDAGDEVLRQMASFVKEHLRETDVLGRLGGEEFAIILLETDAAGVIRVIERLRKALEDTPFTVSEKEIHVTASFGISMCSETSPAATVDNLLKEADQAMYHAKGMGRNKLALFHRNEGRAEILGPSGEQA